MTRKTYTGPLLDVSFDAEVCRHSGNCVRGMPAVFDTAARPWIDPTVASDEDRAAHLRAVIATCPSGALRVEEH